MDDLSIVEKYNEPLLESLLGTSVAPSKHAPYLKHYFKEKRAKSIVIEGAYIDKDYLEDYAAYYSRCFTGYKRECVRLHFFNFKFSEKDLWDVIEGGEGRISKDNLRKGYIGFIVLKPLPQKRIGRTCLKTYDEKSPDGKRFFPTTRKYNSNLFGIDMGLESLAFQEQDKSVAACATSAMWSVFQKTGIEFQHKIPSPAEITDIANKRSPLASRAFPSGGLNVEQMAGAIRYVGLVPHYIGDIKARDLRGVLYAYMQSGLPAIFGYSYLEKLHKGAEFVYKKRDEYHAVAITGYHMVNTVGEDAGVGEPGELRLISNRIDKFYVHDDQICPFARMNINIKKAPLMSKSGNEKPSEEILKNACEADADIYPETVLIPLYHKIRIPYEFVYERIEILQKIIGPVLEGMDKEYKMYWWDITLTKSNKYKTNLLSNGLILGEHLRETLRKPLPRFLWVASLILKEKRFIDVLIDATDLENGSFLRDIVVYEIEDAVVMCTGLVNSYTTRDIDKMDISTRQILDELLEIPERYPGLQPTV